MIRSTLLLALLVFLPLVTYAQQTVQSFGWDLVRFINITLLPFIFAIAFVIFLYYTIRYFIVDVNDYSGKEMARNYAIYSIFAFVLMVSIWGIVNLFVSGIGFGQQQAVCPDTIPLSLCRAWGGTSGSTGSNFQPNSPILNNDGFGTDPQGEFGGTNTDANVRAEQVAMAQQAYETELEDVSLDLIGTLLDAANGDMEAELKAVETHDNLMAVLEDPNSSDQAKADRLGFLLGEGYITSETYTATLTALNNKRAADGNKPAVFPSGG